VDDSGAIPGVGQAQSAVRPAFDLVVSKLRCPPTRRGTVLRSSLLDRLMREDSRPVVSVVAPAGYGKTTLLSQWAERNGQAFAWVSVDEADNDPRVLLSYVAAALDKVQPVSRRVFEALASPLSSVAGSVVPRLGAAFSSMTIPVALVLDDVHLLSNQECRSALSVLADHVPTGSRLVLAGRDKPPLRIARLRGEDRLLEIGLGDLSLSGQEAAVLLRAAEVTLGEDDVAVLHQRTEGWPAGLYLAALYLREGGSLGDAALSFGGDDRLVSQYMEAELLARISQQHRVFLTRTAVLSRMCESLCEAVLGLPDPAVTLAGVARSNLLLVPLDRHGEWYRYHHLFRDMLLAEMERVEPGLLPVLRSRAAGWCLRNGQPEQALEYFMAAGDVAAVARLVGQLALPVMRQARITTLQRWFRWLDSRGGIHGHPMTAVWASMLAAQVGWPDEAERWADMVDRWQLGDGTPPEDPAAEAWAAVLRAIMCRRGVEQMHADADEAVRRFTAMGTVPPVARLCQGIALVLSGDRDGGDASFARMISEGEEFVPDALTTTLCERSLLAMERGEWNKAEAFTSQAAAVMRTAGIEDALVCAVAARVALHRGDAPAARQELISAQRARPLMTYAEPHVAVQARIELTRVHLELGDLAGARMLMGEIDDVLRRRPGLGTLVSEAGALRARLAEEGSAAVPGASALTAAELRLLPLLSTHLSVPQIAAERYLSPHTIKSQMRSIYRKLGISSRNQAVTRAREMGLLEG